MAILCSIVEMANDLLAVNHSNLLHGSTIRPQSVSNDCLGYTVSLHGFLQKPECSGLITGFGDIALQDFILMIDGAPEVVLDAIDLHKHLIQLPLPLSVLAHVGRSFRPDLTCEDWTKSIYLKPHAFVADVDAALMQQTFHIA